MVDSKTNCFNFWNRNTLVNKHIKNIFSDEELFKSSTISILETVQKEGNREVKRLVET